MPDHTAQLRATIAKTPLEHQAPLLADLAMKLRLSDPQQALITAKKALQLAKQHCQPEIIAKCHNVLGAIYHAFGQYQTATSHFEQTLTFYRHTSDDWEGLSAVLNNLGVTCYVQGQYDTALKYYLDSLKLRERLGNKAQIAGSYGNIAAVYFDMENYQKALEFYLKETEIKEEIGDQEHLGNAYIGLGVVYEALQEYEKSLEYYHKAIHIQEQFEDRKGLSISYGNIGFVYSSLHQAEQALKYYFKALAIKEDLNDASGLTSVYLNIADMYLQQHQYDTAENYLEKALTTAQSTGAKLHEMDCYHTFSELYEAKGNYRHALHYYKQYTAVKEALFNREKARQIAEIQTQYETEKKEKEAEIYRLKNVELVKMVEKLETLHQEKNEFLGLVSHDLKNPLTYIRGTTDLVLEYGAKNYSKTELIELFPSIRENCDRMLKMIRNLLDINRLESNHTQFTWMAFDLNHVVEQVVEQHQLPATEKNISIHLEIPSQPAEIYADADAVKQILENLLSNALKYSYPHSPVTVRVIPQEQTVRVEVRDQGQGLSKTDLAQVFNKFTKLSAQPTAGEESTGLGLSIVKKLTELMQGDVKVESAGKGHGATFTVTFPTAPKNAD
ncbi:MAG: hypothetical protein D6675_00560 [Gemmatimonadetes bacterium]|nr:MAG: hypothetical protein D6675_00560 [Gemmatimonadota bacterium]